MKNFLLKFYPEITGLIVFITYMFTIGPSIGENDSGELAMAQATLSIPHPTGYPLFVLIGYLFSKIPLPFPVIFRLNLLNAIWCSLTVINVIRISSLLLQNFYLLLSNKGKSITGTIEYKSSEKITATVFPGFMLAYSATFWLQSTKVEVYSFQIFLTSLIILYTLKNFVNIKKENEPGSLILNLKKWWVLFVVIGFGFSNHLMTLYLLPATLVIFFFSEGLNKKSFSSILLLLIITGLVAFLLYMGLMFRAKMNPPWSYGDPSTFKSLVNHVTAQEYTRYMIQGFDSVEKQGSVLLKMLSFNFTEDNFSTGEFSISVLFGIAGLLLLFLIKKEVSLYFILIVFVSLILAFSYKIPDINEYFLVPFLVLSVLSVIPILFLIKIIRSKKIYLLVLYIFLTFLILTQYVINFNYADRSSAYIFEDFYKSSVANLPPNSILLTDSWSLFLSPGFYFRDVENFRNDVSIISPSGIILHQWYGNRQSVEVLDSSVIIKHENLFISFDVFRNLINKGIISLPPKSILIPYPYFYRVVSDDTYYPVKKKFDIRLNKKPYNEFDEYIYFLLPFMMEQRIIYELSYGETEKASYYYQKIRNSFKDYELSEMTIFALNRNGIITH